ncbi:alpha/beta hydrolase [Hymenobacter tibetensis]|uniref:Alpha/beta hydrolase n=1 Tax=Hymenobacter tibetensis TaxID=497967 RepID=A0ABY4CUI4_9BACT|nr:alpha/beta hydrolase [Hymenobacter tibetensis]UOG73938.1 alpha/beta hydrolase [Hymenobacter tibetensis]
MVLLGSACASTPQLTQLSTPSSPKATAPFSGITTDSLRLQDPTRKRLVPVVTYAPAIPQTHQPRLKVALLNHGYGGKNTDYSFIARNLVAHHYFVASIQHELPGDEPIANTGNLLETRKPHWQRGVENMHFVLTELRRRQPGLDYRHLLLVGHSNGGDMVMLFAAEHPAQVQRVVSLDNRRMPLPRTRRPRVLSLRSSDQLPDSGVLPSPAEQAKLGTQIVWLPATRHNDMWDGATPAQQQEMNAYISRFLEK